MINAFACAVRACATRLHASTTNKREQAAAKAAAATLVDGGGGVNIYHHRASFFFCVVVLGGEAFKLSWHNLDEGDALKTACVFFNLRVRSKLLRLVEACS